MATRRLRDNAAALAPFAGAVATAAALYSSFPPLNSGWAAWFALLPLSLSAFNASGKHAFLAGFAAGFIAYAGIFSWLVPMLQLNTGSSIQALLCLVLLAGYLALFVSFWAGCTRLLMPLYPTALLPLISAAVWVTGEYIRAYAFTGFPWAALGYSQWQMPALIQYAEFTGVFGVSAVLLVVNGYWYLALRQRKVRYAALAAGILLAAAGSGHVQRHHLLSRQETAAAVTVALIQPNIDQYKKWSQAYAREILATIERLVMRAATEKPQVIVWPETAVPGYLPDDAILAGWVSRCARASGAWQIIGAPYHPSPETYVNASLLVAPDGSVQGVHAKNHLVPFGEYVPFRKILEPYFGVLNTLGDFTRGSDANVFRTGTAAWGISICSENFFGAQACRSVRAGAGILASQTNDAWFLNSPAAEQHFGMNVFRAIETRRPVVVCGNTGISGCITPDGSIASRTCLGTEEVRIVTVRPAAGNTFYCSRGDVFARCAAGITILLVLTAAIRGGRQKREVHHV